MRTTLTDTLLRIQSNMPPESTEQDAAEQHTAEQEAKAKEMEARVRDVDDETWNHLVEGIGGDTPVRVVWKCCPADFRAVVLVSEHGDAYTVYTSQRDAADWTVRERSTRGGVIQYWTPSREKGRMSVVEAVARGWVGEPPGEEYEAEQTGEPLTKENVEWTRDPTLSELLEGEEDLSAKVYRFIQYGVRKIRKREGLSIPATAARFGFEGQSNTIGIIRPGLRKTHLERGLRYLSGPGENIRMTIVVNLHEQELETEMSSKEVDARGSHDKQWREKVQEQWRDWMRALLQEVIAVFREENPDWRLSEVAERLNTHTLMMSSIRKKTRPASVDSLIDLLDEVDARVEVEIDTIGTETFHSKNSSS